MIPPWLGGGLADGDTKGPTEEEGGGEGEEEQPPNVNPLFKNMYQTMYSYYSANKKEANHATKEDLLKKNEEFKKRIAPLKEEIAKLEKPDGSQKHPARTCRDLHQHYPAFTTGEYWIDPNLGCSSDAIKVTCTFTKVEGQEDQVTTCVKPTTTVKHDKWGMRMKNKEKVLFGEDHQLGELKYEADHSQLEYLGLLSASATQDMTVTCSNYRGNIAFLGTKNTEFSTQASRAKQRPDVIGADNCAESAEGSTVLRFNTRKFVNLPIVDFRPDFSADGQYGVAPGPVCFA